SAALSETESGISLPVEREFKLSDAGEMVLRRRTEPLAARKHKTISVEDGATSARANVARSISSMVARTVSWTAFGRSASSVLVSPPMARVYTTSMKTAPRCAGTSTPGSGAIETCKVLRETRNALNLWVWKIPTPDVVAGLAGPSYGLG